MVIETVVMINLFPLPGYSQYLALSWVELHLPVFPRWQVCRGRIEVYHSQHLSLPQGTLSCHQPKPNGRLEFFMDVIHVIKE